MNKVLILSNPSDIHTDLVIRDLQAIGVEFVRLHTQDFPSGVEVVHRDGNTSIRIRDGGRTFDLADIRSVWNRRPKPSIPDVSVAGFAHRRFVAVESERLLEECYALLERVLWVNSFPVNQRARNKLLQQRVARSVGLEVPHTIVTNEPSSVRAFLREYKKVVYKTVRNGVVEQEDGSSHLIFTSMVSEADIQRLEDVQFAPCVFQEYVEKRLEIRATLVGSRIFSAAIHSQEVPQTSVDWRKGGARYEVYDLPESIQTQLRLVANRLGLLYGAFDLILTPDNRFVMLEVNPNGQWAFVQGFTGMPISRSIAELLAHSEGVS